MKEKDIEQDQSAKVIRIKLSRDPTAVRQREKEAKLRESLKSGSNGFRYRVVQPIDVHVGERVVATYLQSSPESKEVGILLRNITASRKRSQKTQKEIERLRKRNQALLAKL